MSDDEDRPTSLKEPLSFELVYDEAAAFEAVLRRLETVEREKEAALQRAETAEAELARLRALLEERGQS
jgi:hypothetical protein